MIVGRLLEMAAIGPHLRLHLLPYDAPARLGPAPCVGEAGEQRAQRVQGHRLAQQVGIGRKIDRQIPFDEAAMAVQDVQEPAAQRLRHLRPREHPEPRPGQAAERRFERTGPIHAAQERVPIHPAFQLAERFVQIRPIAAQQKSLGEQWQVLMAIQLPNHFVVAHPREIEIRHGAEIGSPRGDAAGVIAPPVYVRPRFDGQPEQRKAVLQQALGQRQNLRGVRCSAKRIGRPTGSANGRTVGCSPDDSVGGRANIARLPASWPARNQISFRLRTDRFPMWRGRPRLPSWGVLGLPAVTGAQLRFHQIGSSESRRV